MGDSKWYVLATKTGEEKKVADLLTQKGIPNYCPLTKLNGRWKERTQAVYCPIFPGYVFVYLAENNLNMVSSVTGVKNFIFWLDKFAVIHDDEIIAIKNFLSEYAGIKLEKTPINRNDHYRIIYGPLVVREGDQYEVRNSPVSVILPSMGYILIAQERQKMLADGEPVRIIQTRRERLFRRVRIG